MTTYAQNFEDVTLRRALNDITGGFYVDIGAAWPTRDSVTRWFYDQGWRGINIEPNPEFLTVLRKERPRDINIGAAIRDGKESEVVLHVAEDGGTSTTDTYLVHLANIAVKKTLSVPCLSLDQLLSDNEPLPTIDFLKIDAEGAEPQIIEGAQFVRYRPRIVIAEGLNFAAYNPIMQRKGYHFVWFDALNAFYLREEDAWRSDLLARPPSLWDNATPFAVAELTKVLANRQPTRAVSGSLRSRVLSGCRRFASSVRQFRPKRLDK